jgi:cytochrome-b5 reductase
MSRKDPGSLEKARKVQLEPGFSLPAWMTFSADKDLSGGVGKADLDEEESWKAWPIAEIRKHNTREDFWSVIRGKVYNLTPYLRYHPGGIDILMKTAGNDGTVLFDK